MNDDLYYSEIKYSEVGGKQIATFDLINLAGLQGKITIAADQVEKFLEDCKPLPGEETN